MIRRPFWISEIEQALRKRPVVWLAGVRRVGKTTLARMLPDAVFHNYDLPSTVRRLEDPEAFLRSLRPGTRVVLDEVHRLADPSRLLKIAADEFPRLRLLATGSSTLSATRKFRDSLTGRRTALHLPPVLWSECGSDFAVTDLDRRMLHGGLPEALLADRVDEEACAEWMDSFYARDIQELFGIRERSGFLNLLRLMLRQSGGMVDYSALSRECDLSRPTVKAHLEAMTIACALNVVHPFHGGSRRELVRRPRIYGFDTGFVCFVRGWRALREDDRGPLWEHLVLDELRAVSRARPIQFWRDKSDREVDFVIARGATVDTFECKIDVDRRSPESLRVFREAYPRGRNYLVSPFVAEPYDRTIGTLRVRVVSTRHLAGCLAAER
jgi:hypothetical protein